MEKSRRMVASVLLCVLAMGLCLAQHWSYGLQPGGKRSAQVLLGPFQEVANEMEKLEEVQQSECPGSYQNSRIRDLKEAMCWFYPPADPELVWKDKSLISLTA